jgi:phosphoglycerate kinase
MHEAKKTLRDLNGLKDRRALVRVDFNVPLDANGDVANDRRIRAALPTLRYILEGGGSAVVMSHLGRPKGDPKKDKLLTMDRVAARLQHLIEKPVKKINQLGGAEAERAAGQLGPREILVLENLRFDPREQAGDQEFGRLLARLGDLYVNDAFGTCHRADASMVAVPRAIRPKPRVVGFLVARELEILGQLLGSPAHPFVALLGGAKVSDKIGFIKSLLVRIDRLLVGGAMSYTFMKALGKETGASKVELEKLDLARALIDQAGGKLELPRDHVVVLSLDKPDSAKIVDGEIPPGMTGVDIGPRTIAYYSDVIRQSATALWNGPVGKYEDLPYRRGTESLARALAEAKGVRVVGGGETADAVEEFGLADQMTHVSTGGGAFLEYVEGTPLPALAEIDEK